MTYRTIEERIAAIEPDALLTIEAMTTFDTDADGTEGPSEPWIRLDVDGAPFLALPRQAFLDAFHRAIHEVQADADPEPVA